MRDFFIFAGEPSGDLHGSALMRALKASQPSIQFCGVGGPLMRAEGLNGDLNMEDFQVMGFSDVLKALPRLWSHFYQIVREIVALQPQLLILIDYPGFNLRLAKALRKRGYQGKIVQYISPSVWAHGKSRITTMVSTLDLLLIIYPFEKECFSNSSLKVEYIGNPLVENLKNWRYDSNWQSHLKISQEEKWIALFPGSRTSEVKRHFPLQLDIISQLKKKHSRLKVVCCYVNSEHLELMKKFIKSSPFQLDKDFFFISSHFRYEVMQNCYLALAKSGTVTLELALLKKPTLVIYELSYLNHFLAKYFLRLNLPHYCIVNILAKTEVFPEFIGSNLSAKIINPLFQKLYEDKKQHEEICEKCQKVIDVLGDKQTHQAASSAILGLLE